jgi:hypothetical protein
MSKRGEPPEQASRAFSVAHGHFPIGGPEHLHEPFEEYESWLKANRLAHSPDRLHHWVEHDYRAPDPVPDRLTIRTGPRTSRRDRAATPVTQ